MNRFKYILYTIIIGLLGSGLTAQAMLKRGAGRILSPVLQNASKIAKNSNIVHFTTELGTEVGKEGYQQVGKRAARGGVKALFTGVHTKSSSILSENKNKSFKKTKKSIPIVSIDDVTGKVRFNDDSQPSEKRQVALTNNAPKDQVEENKEEEMTGPEQVVPANKTENFNISDVVSRVFAPKTQQTADAKQIVSAGKTEAQSQDALKVEATKLEQKTKQTKENKKAKKLEEKKKKNVEKAVERRKKDDVKFNAKREKLEKKLSEDFQKQLQLRKDQETRAQQKLEKETRVPETKGQDLAPTPLRDNLINIEQQVEQPKGLSTIATPKNINARYPLNFIGKTNTVHSVRPTVGTKTTKPANVRRLKQLPVVKNTKETSKPVDTETGTLVPIRNQNSDSATQLVRSEDPMSLVEIEKLLTDEVVVNITTDNPVTRLKQLDAIYGDALNNQLAVKNSAKNQPLILEQTGRGEVKRAVLFVPTQQLKDILGKFGVRFNGKKPTQIIISPSQARNALDAITRPKQPALPEAQGKDLGPVTPPCNNRIIDVPVVEKPQELLTTPVTKALVPVTKPSRVLVPKRVQAKRGKLVVAEKVRAKVDSTGLKVEAEKIDIPEQERFEQGEVTREQERFERERDEQRRDEEQRNRDREREEEQKEQERLEREREEQRRDREREETEKEISKRNKRLRRGPKLHADLANDNDEELMTARRAENRPGVITAGAAAAISVDPVAVSPQPTPMLTSLDSDLEPPYVPRQDPRISDYRKILAMARKPIAELTRDNVRMKIKWAHGESGIERMLYAFNKSVDIMRMCKNDTQLSNEDPNRRYSLEAISTFALCLESVKKGIIDDMVRALTELGSSEQATGLLMFRA